MEAAEVKSICQAPHSQLRGHHVDKALLLPVPVENSGANDGNSPARSRRDERAILKPTQQSIFNMAAEQGFCFVLPWLEKSDLHRIRMASPEDIQQWQHSLACPLRGVWRDPAPEDANNILAR